MSSTKVTPLKTPSHKKNVGVTVVDMKMNSGHIENIRVDLSEKPASIALQFNKDNKEIGIDAKL